MGKTGATGATGTTGKTGERGKTGQKGIAGDRGRVGSHGPAGKLVGSEHTEILILQRRIEDIYEGLSLQTQRTTDVELKLDTLRAVVGNLIRG